MHTATNRHHGRPGRFGARAVPAVVLVVAATAASTGTSVGAEPTQLLPDLVADPVTNPRLETYSVLGQPNRLLLRFDGYVHNRGVGPVEVRGSSPVEREQTNVSQRIYYTGGGYEDVSSSADLRLVFEPEDGHEHWHLPRAAEYSLRGPAGEVASQKVGFCLVDSQHVDSWGPGTAVYTTASNRYCERYNATADSVTMGVSSGWRDRYGSNLAFQWVDISDVQPGSYQIESDADPGNVIVESDENNKPTLVGATVPGYAAKDFTQQVSAWFSRTFTLPTNRFGDAGTAEYSIVDPPDKGTLKTSGSPWFTGSVTYTAKPGSSGQDSFTFMARDKSRPFPLTPRTATATLSFGILPLQLSAANTTDGGSTMTTPTVAANAEPRPAPDVTQPLPAPDGRPIAAPQVELRHGDLIVRTVPWRSGAVRLRMTRADGTVARCSAKVPAGQPFTCLLASGLTAADVQGRRVVADLRTAGKVVGSRATIARP